MSVSLDSCLVNTGVPQERSTWALGCGCHSHCANDIPAVLPCEQGLLLEINGLLPLPVLCCGDREVQECGFAWAFGGVFLLV